MDSLLKLKLHCDKLLNSDHLDHDLIVNMTASDIAQWCKDYLRIYENIDETSISKSHKVERKNKLVDIILSR